MKTNYINKLQRDMYIGECKGNNSNGCFLDSSGQNCGCFTKVEEPKSMSLNTIQPNGKSVKENIDTFFDNTKEEKINFYIKELEMEKERVLKQEQLNEVHDFDVVGYIKQKPQEQSILSIEERAKNYDKSNCKHFKREHTKEEVYDSFEEGFIAGANEILKELKETLENRINELKEADAQYCFNRWDNPSAQPFEKALAREESNKVTFARQELERILKTLDKK